MVVFAPHPLWLFILLSSFVMADIDLTARYALINPLLGSSRSLASTSLNDSLLVAPSTSDSSQSWYFTSTSSTDYYRLHTVAKGDQNALDVDNYYGSNSIDMHFYYVQPRSGQFWKVSKQSDGSVKISNNYTGSDIFLDIDESNLKPTLRAGDGEGTRWTLSSPGSTPTATDVTTLASPLATTMSTAVSISRSSAVSTGPGSTCTVECSATNTPSPKPGKLSTGAIAGIVVGGAIVLGAVVGLLLYRRWRNSRAAQLPDRPARMTSNPMLNLR
ncbi:hypothetical protein BU25DRAFT_265478 [Macroventuria anomochaeta]|uniref:Uncharacterized protein n=1 Tax=Macroventuria anomochaeta TaxID=301207 RepID=A0ACB6S7A9_9PLEO|nr:uncharacterized protein BU25DRAFT_265478 [Macroventuria anomochaeta]KAF2630091.1 hypothetical protein BU25DRAFT_265478 [Macroventuria anomochaeta]